MSWVIKSLTSSLGKKVLMSFTGLFLIVFLLIHMIGNLAVLSNDGGLAFNAYAATMSTNPLIKSVSYLLYFSVLLHMTVASGLYFSNKFARPVGYARQDANANSSWASRSMMLLGILIFAFLFLHLKDFWWQYKHSDYQFEIDANGNRDLYALVVDKFSMTFTLISYLIGLVALSVHLIHGFQSAFQTLGLEHKKYTPIIKAVGVVFSIVVPLGFALMPLYIYFK